MTPSRSAKTTLALLLLAAVAGAPRLARADDVVIVRELHTQPGMPLGGSIRTTQRVGGQRVREEMVATLIPIKLDSLETAGSGRDTSAVELMANTTIWFPEDRVWRSWSGADSTYEESTVEEVTNSARDQEDGMGYLSAMFGSPRDLAQELTVAVDSSWTESTIAGVRARLVVVRGTLRFYELESNVGDSLRFVREVWTARAIPGADELLARVSPSEMFGKMIASFHAIMLPTLKGALRRLDEEVARMAGHLLRDEVRIEPANEKSAALPDSTKSWMLYHAEVLEIRNEPSRPELFRLAEGARKRESPRRSGDGR